MGRRARFDHWEIAAQQKALDACAMDYGLRSVRTDEHASYRYGTTHATESLDRQLESLAELMGANRWEIGAGRRIAITMTNAARVTYAAQMEGPGLARITVDPEHQDGSNLAAAWMNAVLAIVEEQNEIEARERIAELKRGLAGGAGAKRHAFAAGNARRRRKGESTDARVLGRSFEAFMADEGCEHEGGDVAPSWNDAAQSGTCSELASLYPDASARIETNGLWTLIRGRLMWSEDTVVLALGRDDIAQSEAMREERDEHDRHARQVFTRLTARSAEEHPEQEKIAEIDHEGGITEAGIWTREIVARNSAEDDGAEPELKERWLYARVVDALARHARDALDFDARSAQSTLTKDDRGHWHAQGVSWSLADDTKGGFAYDETEQLVTLESASGRWRLGQRSVEDAVQQLLVASAFVLQFAWDNEAPPAQIRIEWHIMGNTFTVEVGGKRKVGTMREFGGHELKGRTARREIERGLAKLVQG